jgi:hypothetical protein
MEPEPSLSDQSFNYEGLGLMTEVMPSGDAEVTVYGPDVEIEFAAKAYVASQQLNGQREVTFERFYESLRSRRSNGWAYRLNRNGKLNIEGVN